MGWPLRRGKGRGGGGNGGGGNGGGSNGGGDDLAALRARAHRGVTTIDYSGSGGGAADGGAPGGALRTVPCILVGPSLFARMVRTVAGKPFSIMTNMNIFRDGLGHVFVDLSLDFEGHGISESFLIDAAESYEFFDLLAETSVLAISPEGGSGAAGGPAGVHNVIMVQLPRPEKAAESLEMIREGLAAGGRGRGGA